MLTVMFMHTNLIFKYKVLVKKNSAGANFIVGNFLMHIIVFQYCGSFATVGRISQPSL